MKRIQTLARARLITLTLLLALPVPHLQAVETNVVAIAAAADLVFCLGELNRSFTNRYPNTRLRLVTGSSGNFYAQIERAAPFDVFLSADASYPRRLAESGHAEPASLTHYAVGRLVLWTQRADLAVTNGLTVLTNASVRKVALASPEHAPYGRAAREALEHAALWSALRPKLVLGENISQTAHFVETSNVDAGLVALALVSAPQLKNSGTWWLVPEAWHSRLEQAAILTRRGATNQRARAYLEFLGSEKARGIFEEFGFRLPKP